MHTAKVYAAVALSVALLQETSGQGYTQGPSGRTPNQPGSCGSYDGAFDFGLITPGSGRTAPVVLIGKPGIRCTEAARDRLESAEVCFTDVDAAQDLALFDYMKCIHPETDMHSFVYFDGVYVGDGFRLLSDPGDWRCARNLGAAQVGCMDDALFAATVGGAGAALGACSKDCGHVVDDQYPPRFPALFEQEIASSPIALFGWNGCPCTGKARAHFQAHEYCYMENVWQDPENKLFEYLQCRYGEQHHSFIFVGGQFLDNGFAFDERSPRAKYGSEAVFHPMAVAAHARESCPFVGLENLRGGDLQSCTQQSDATATGWTRSGSCNWDPSDGGYHEVCVEMSRDFLDSSANNDGNDLSRVVSQGGHWCICAWAFASAVTRDPGTLHPQGITLDCDATNGKLRDVYTHFATLRSPSGATYKSQTALALVEQLCPRDALEVRPEDDLAGGIDEVSDANRQSIGKQQTQAAANEPDEALPCYTVQGKDLQLPFMAACPALAPLPSNCPVGCSEAYKPWWERCRANAFVQSMDGSLGGAFTTFAQMCKHNH